MILPATPTWEDLITATCPEPASLPFDAGTRFEVAVQCGVAPGGGAAFLRLLLRTRAYTKVLLETKSPRQVFDEGQVDVMLASLGAAVYERLVTSPGVQLLLAPAGDCAAGSESPAAHPQA